MTTDNFFTEPPWSCDVEGIIYAVNGRAGQTTVATLSRGAPAQLLAAAPDLAYALEECMECLEHEFANLSPGARRNSLLEARNFLKTTIAKAGLSYPDSKAREHLWTVNADLPPSEQKANARLLAAAEDLWNAAMMAHSVLASHVDNPEVVGLLHNAIVQSGRVFRDRDD